MLFYNAINTNKIYNYSFYSLRLPRHDMHALIGIDVLGKGPLVPWGLCHYQIIITLVCECFKGVIHHGLSHLELPYVPQFCSCLRIYTIISILYIVLYKSCWINKDRGNWGVIDFPNIVEPKINMG